MKILMTLESFFPPDKRVENEAEALISAGYQVDIICFGSPGQAAVEEYHGVTIRRIFPPWIIRKSSVGALKMPVYFAYWMGKIRNILKRNSYDVVHIHDLPLVKPVTRLKNRFHFKIVLDLHENWPALLSVSPHTKTIAGRILCNITEWENYEKKYVNSADRIIVVVDEARDRILPYTDDPGKIAVVSNTINTEEFDRQKIIKSERGNKVIFIYEGGITYHRGLQNIILALSRIRPGNTEFELRIIGNGSYLPHLKKMVSTAGLSGRVIFYGWKPLGEVYSLLGEADVALIPHLKSSHTDNTIPHKLFHYIYSGLPVLASDCNPLERIVKETGCGIIYRYDDIDSLVTAIENIINDPGSLKKYSDSRSWVMKKYNWNNDRKELINLYSNLI